MFRNKITLEDLANFGDTKIDLEQLSKKEDQAASLLKDEIADFISKSDIKKTTVKRDFYSSVPSSKLKESIENLLRKSNKQEEILKKNAKSEFDAKMARVKKIKSKVYRKMARKEKLRKKEELEMDLSSENVDFTDFKPHLEFNNKENEELDSQQKIVREVFDTSSTDSDFEEEKKEIVKEEQPLVITNKLPGWDDWAGEGIAFVSNKINTSYEYKEGIRNKDRQDYNKNNVIINENTEINPKYLSKLPYGYTYRDYKGKISTPISTETNSLRIFNRFVKISKKDETPSGKDIESQRYNPEY